ncbi:MAG: hypothetical protein U9R25_14950 [Chloroflexota bacterium]|nr:hypothetical protein [Chloroflexota bacterium]
MLDHVASTDLKSNAYMFDHRDGLLDSYLGLMLLAAGLLMQANLIFLVGIVPASMLPAYQSAKRSVTAPRQEQLNTGPDRSRRSRNLMLIVLAVGFTALGLAILITGGVGAGEIPAWLTTGLRTYGMLAAALAFATGFSLVAHFGSLPRYVSFAVLALAIFGLGQGIGFGFPTGLMILGGVMVLGGLLTLVRFVRTYPVEATK